MIIFFILLSLLSIAVNVVMVWYTKTLLKRFYFASEALSEIFVRIDAFKEHLKSVFDLEIFYGDRNLKDLIEHTKDLIKFMKKFESLYSFTQPELEEILKEEDNGEEEKEIEKKD